MSTSSPNGSNGRNANGRFAAGNPGGPGNPHARRVARLRAELLRAVTPQDLRNVIAALLRKARRGDVPAIRELLQRLLGPPVELDFAQRLDALEQALRQLQQRTGQW
ncbi:hypothetical protein [Fontivita pretiosa]|uniref:hypothetical protein n=1 Tax=Fontivita pretiosa TaxID=2989684 RepID=UPI003D16CBF2